MFRRKRCFLWRAFINLWTELSLKALPGVPAGAHVHFTVSSFVCKKSFNQQVVQRLSEFWLDRRASLSRSVRSQSRVRRRSRPVWSAEPEAAPPPRAPTSPETARPLGQRRWPRVAVVRSVFENESLLDETHDDIMPPVVFSADTPSQRVQFILGTEDDDEEHIPHDLFTELDELAFREGDFREWKETARRGLTPTFI